MDELVALDNTPKKLSIKTTPLIAVGFFSFCFDYDAGRQVTSSVGKVLWLMVRTDTQPS